MLQEITGQSKKNSCVINMLDYRQNREQHKKAKSARDYATSTAEVFPGRNLKK